MRAGPRAIAFARSLLGRARLITGRVTRRYYAEDFVRVYPDGEVRRPLGRRRPVSEDERRSFLNHRKLYAFAAQFASGRRVLDAGCGSGYGSALLAEAGASVTGIDASRQAIRFAKQRFGERAEFSRALVTRLDAFDRDVFGLVVCSEVLEHVKDYGKELDALAELRRVTSPDGVLVVATPNTELLPGHGFSYDEIVSVCDQALDDYVLFENLLVPFESSLREVWLKRMASGRVGLVAPSRVDLDETVAPSGATPAVKTRTTPGRIEVAGNAVDLTALHNTHSWVVLASGGG